MKNQTLPGIIRDEIKAAITKNVQSNPTNYPQPNYQLGNTPAPSALTGYVSIDQSTPQEIGNTGDRLLKLWVTDITATNAIEANITGNAATVTTNANLTGVITSVGNATSIASQTGTGSKFVVDTAPKILTTLDIEGLLKIYSTTPAALAAQSALSLNYNLNIAGIPVGFDFEGTLQSSANHCIGLFQNLILEPATAKHARFMQIGGTVNAVSGRTIQAYGLYIPAMVKTGTGTISNCYGLVIDEQTIGTKNYAIFQSGASMISYFAGLTGLRVVAPTAVLHLPAGTATAGTAPLKINSGTLLTAPEIGAVEFVTDKLYTTITTGTARKEITLNDGSLTSGRVPVATTNGRLTDDAGFTRVAGVSKIGDGTNYTEFEADGTLKMVGTATTFNDINTGINPRNTGTGRPTLTAFNGNISEFRFAVNDYADLTPIEFLHDWKEGSQIELHCHWAMASANDATVRGVKWEIEYTWANMAGVFSTATASSTESSIAANEVALTHHYTSIVSFTPTGGQIGSQLCFRIKRIASVTNVAPDTDPFLLSIGIHYEKDTIGSRTISAK